MTRPIHALLIAGLVAAVAAAQPAGAAAQEAPAAALSTCAAADSADPFLARVVAARDLEPKAAEAALAALEPEAQGAADERPADAAAQYRLAAVLGAQLDHESGGAKMSGASAVRDRAMLVLALEPGHAGASYMLGRIHSSILRMSGFKRFVAKRLFGGDALDGASWETAETLLEAAVQGDPCVPDHHFELARVYAHTGDVDGAERALASVRELTADATGAEARLRDKAAQFEKEWRDNGRKI